MSALTQKQLRDAAPVETLPFEITRRYGEPHLYKDIGAVRRALLGDLDEVSAMQENWRSKDLGDMAEVARLRTEFTGLTEDMLPLDVSVVVDTHTGVRYQVTVIDRRKP